MYGVRTRKIILFRGVLLGLFCHKDLDCLEAKFLQFLEKAFFLRIKSFHIHSVHGASKIIPEIVFEFVSSMQD